MDEGTQEKVATPLMPKEERHNIVRSFIDAYIRGAVIISFPTEEGLKAAGVKDASERERASKRYFLNLVEKATGAVKLTQIELEETIDKLFGSIVALRIGRRIEGEFLQVPNVESKLNSLEERVCNIERLLEELQNLMRVRAQEP